MCDNELWNCYLKSPPNRLNIGTCIRCYRSLCTYETDRCSAFALRMSAVYLSRKFTRSSSSSKFSTSTASSISIYVSSTGSLMIAPPASRFIDAGTDPLFSSCPVLYWMTFRLTSCETDLNVITGVHNVTVLSIGRTTLYLISSFALYLMNLSLIMLELLLLLTGAALDL